MNSPFKSVVKNLPFHNFEETPVYIGMYVNTLELGEEEKFTANVFANVETGEEVFITNSYSIEKAIKQATETLGKEFVLRIEFLGKTTVKGKPFNQYNIAACTVPEYQESLKPEKAKAK